MAEDRLSRYPHRTRLPTMAFTATSALTPFRSRPPPISSSTAWASWFRAWQDTTFSRLFTRSSMLGFTSRDTTEVTAWACCTSRPPPPSSSTARQAATVCIHFFIRLFFFFIGTTVPFRSVQRESTPSTSSGAVLSSAAESLRSI